MIVLMLFLNSTFSYGEEQFSDDTLLMEGDSLENTLDRKLKASGNAVLKKMAGLLMRTLSNMIKYLMSSMLLVT